MRGSTLLALAAILAASAWYSGASAQGVGIYVGPAYEDRYDREDGYRDGTYGYAPRYPRSYGYSSRRNYDNDYPRRYRQGCGTYRFWNGERCVDARR